MMAHARSARMVWLTACLALVLALPATAVAQSGAPGASGADDAVYGTPNGPGILGNEPEEASGGGGPAADPGAGDPTAVPAAGVDPGEAGGEVRSIPFTGLVLAGLLITGVALVAAGGGLRLVARTRASRA